MVPGKGHLQRAGMRMPCPALVDGVPLQYVVQSVWVLSKQECLVTYCLVSLPEHLLHCCRYVQRAIAVVTKMTAGSVFGVN